jgi:hypothetical protein
MFNSVYADNSKNTYASLSNDYYRTGDYLGVNVIAYEKVVFDIDSVSVYDEKNEKVDYHKGYQMFPRGYLEITQPFPTDMLPGVYNMTFYVGDEIVNVQEFTYGIKPTKLMFTGMTNVIPINDYAFFFGVAQSPKLHDLSFSSSVLVQVLDSNRNLLDDNWRPSDHTAKYDTIEDATQSQFRAAINNGAIYHVTEENKILNDNDIPLYPDGFRFQIRIDPITYNVGEIYIVKVTYDNLTKEYPFLVIDSRTPLGYN